MTKEDLLCYFPNLSITDKTAGKLIDAFLYSVGLEFGFGLNPTIYSCEEHFGDGTCYLHTCAYPIINVMEVTVCGCKVDLCDIEITGKHRECIKINCGVWPKAHGKGYALTDERGPAVCPNIEITYMAGFKCLPAPLEMCIASDIASTVCSKPGTVGALIKEETPGGWNRTWSYKAGCETCNKGILSGKTLEVINSFKVGTPFE